ncbi:hypothetical protein EDC26_1116 [Paralcaligenes ureilyticus]|uniref:Uncharacterized protein n=1 Tax=Paralcaligenes ureilyticus TaxID=627131 RepID=A0A4R3LW01_9BURK|nr:hypothetical protein EDC26_1116 [Paralcaligenes ureilyticus]
MLTSSGPGVARTACVKRLDWGGAQTRRANSPPGCSQASCSNSAPLASPIQALDAADSSSPPAWAAVAASNLYIEENPAQSIHAVSVGRHVCLVTTPIFSQWHPQGVPLQNIPAEYVVAALVAANSSCQNHCAKITGSQDASVRLSGATTLRTRPIKSGEHRIRRFISSYPIGPYRNGRASCTPNQKVYFSYE